METTLALCGAVAGWGVMALITRRRLAVLRLRCQDAEAENTRWRQAHSGRMREPADGRDGPREREAPAAGGGPDFTERAFVNIGRRVQAIVHRQLGDLSEMEERHGGDPAVFADLMRLDHGTALIGRLADSLVVLAGERPGRQWTEPVPVFSVLRGAMSRIVDYRRVELAAAPEVELAGSAVEAVVHALAELLDNATRYSPPDSPVILTARRTAGGVAIEVVDAGVGMAPLAAEHVARVLANPGSPGLDLADMGGSPRLGLAVVGRLAHTVGFQATVRPSAAGGVKAQLFVPDDLVLAPAGAAAAAPVAALAEAEPGGVEADGSQPSDGGDAWSKGAADSRPASLPQRRRRPATPAPAVTVPTVTVPAAANERRVAKANGSGGRTAGPGQWLDAFRGGPTESEGGNSDGDHGERGAAS